MGESRNPNPFFGSVGKEYSDSDWASYADAELAKTDNEADKKTKLEAKVTDSDSIAQIEEETKRLQAQEAAYGYDENNPISKRLADLEKKKAETQSKSDELKLEKDLSDLEREISGIQAQEAAYGYEENNPISKQLTELQRRQEELKNKLLQLRKIEISEARAAVIDAAVTTPEAGTTIIESTETEEEDLETAPKDDSATVIDTSETEAEPEKTAVNPEDNTDDKPISKKQSVKDRFSRWIKKWGKPIVAGALLALGALGIYKAFKDNRDASNSLAKENELNKKPPAVRYQGESSDASVVTGPDGTRVRLENNMRFAPKFSESPEASEFSDPEEAKHLADQILDRLEAQGYDSIRINTSQGVASPEALINGSESILPGNADEQNMELAAKREAIGLDWFVGLAEKHGFKIDRNNLIERDATEAQLEDQQLRDMTETAKRLGYIKADETNQKAIIDGVARLVIDYNAGEVSDPSLDVLRDMRSQSIVFEATRSDHTLINGEKIDIKNKAPEIKFLFPSFLLKYWKEGAIGAGAGLILIGILVALKKRKGSAKADGSNSLEGSNVPDAPKSSADSVILPEADTLVLPATETEAETKPNPDNSKNRKETPELETISDEEKAEIASFEPTREMYLSAFRDGLAKDWDNQDTIRSLIDYQELTDEAITDLQGGSKTAEAVANSSAEKILANWRKNPDRPADQAKFAKAYGRALTEIGLYITERGIDREQTNYIEIFTHEDTERGMIERLLDPDWKKRRISNNPENI